ncbi:MAG: DEAD/DEAH box helicase [Actinomycetaceae bacterium]|nr:DEAD/DEAH box helicase [Actinomycetaceae bacterium]
MKYKPHAYQTQATRFILEHPHAALFLQMGLGKTVITLTALRTLTLLGDTQRALVIAPLRVARDTWPDEIKKWDHLKDVSYQVMVGRRTTREKALSAKADIHIINRENIPWLVDALDGQWPYDTVVIDELSSFKNPRAKRFKAIKNLSRHATRIIGLTGTPSPNGLLDLWAQYRILDGGQRLGKYITHYRNDYFTPDKRNRYQVFTWKPREGAEKEIYAAIGDITMSLQTVDHLQLPERTDTTMIVRMNASERAVYDQLRRDMVVNLGGQNIDAANAASLSGKLLQLASGNLYTPEGSYLPVHERKLDALEDIVEAANGQPVLVAVWYKFDTELIQQRIPSARTLTTSEDMRDWNAGLIPVALIHPASAGHGLNLQAGGSLLVWYSLTWSLELYEQTNARLYRQGQTQPVTVTHLACEDTIDMEVLDALAGKSATQEALVNAVKTRLAV